MRKLWEDEAWKEYLEWQMKDKKVLKRINQLLTDIDRNGYQCIGARTIKWESFRLLECPH